MMTVHHFTPSELRDMTDQITSRTITEPSRRGPTQSDHGIGNHWLRFAEYDLLVVGRVCVFPDCDYQDDYTGVMS